MTIKEYITKTGVTSKTLATALNIPTSTFTYWIRNDKVPEHVQTAFENMTDNGKIVLKPLTQPTASEYYALGQIYGVFATLMPTQMSLSQVTTMAFSTPLSVLSNGTQYACANNIPRERYENKVAMLSSQLEVDHFINNETMPESMQAIWWLGVYAAKSNDMRPYDERMKGKGDK